MGFFSKYKNRRELAKKESDDKQRLAKIERRLATGETNWQLARETPFLLRNRPNVRYFLLKLEEKLDIQIGLHAYCSDIASCSFRIPVYNDTCYPPRFQFLFQIISVDADMIIFYGTLVDHSNPSGLYDRNRKFDFSNQVSEQHDLSPEEFEFYLFDTLNKTIEGCGHNKNEFSIKRKDGGLCFNKCLEKFIREGQ